MAQRSKVSEAASALSQARWAKIPKAKRSSVMAKVRAARTNAPAGRNGGRKRAVKRCYCGLKSWTTGQIRGFDCCKRAGKFPKGE